MSINCYGIHNFVDDRCTECRLERIDIVQTADYYFSASIGGVVYIKVVAESRDAALEAAAHLTIDDFENAGPLKLGDVELEELEIDDLDRLIDGDIIMADGWERSIVVPVGKRPDDYALAPEDPQADDDEVDFGPMPPQTLEGIND